MCRYIVGAISISVLLLATSCSERPPDESLPPNTPTAAQDMASADQFYSQRADLNQVRRGVISLRQATTKDPVNYEAAWKLSKFNYYLAMHTDNAKERDDAFQAGIAAGKTAVELQNEKPDGHFWLGANYGGAAEHSTIQGLATVNDIKSEMETVLRLDEGYQDGSAYMVLGLVYLNAPSIVGGDPKKAVEEMEKGLRFGEPNALLHLHLAEAYRKVGRNDDARREIKRILSLTPDPNYLPEYNEASAAAQKLQEQIDHGG
jgi:tetratricopeptide (TPR) repeat protein